MKYQEPSFSVPMSKRTEVKCLLCEENKTLIKTEKGYLCLKHHKKPQKGLFAPRF